MENIKFKDYEIIGIDHGFGNIKTRNTTFRAGITVSDAENDIAPDVVKYKDKYLIIGENHKSFESDKVINDDYYYLTIAALAKEMRIRKIRSAKLVLAVGLPLMWAQEQREVFRNYLMREKELEFEYKGISYSVTIERVLVFTQGYVAIMERIGELDGIYYVADIGNGTINVMNINDHRINSSKCFTDQIGVRKCIESIQNEIANKMQKDIPYDICEEYLIKGTTTLPERIQTTMDETACRYVSSIIGKLKEHGYDPDYMKLICMGGGSGIVKRYLRFPDTNVEYMDDIRATAKGYEQFALAVLRKEMK
ncbi:plasmid segregation protein ParM [Lachnospiraceae bacterium NE2001]|nr:plasmid segregation protein ParM [Lachnospiraceae bacterium NE2001]